MATTTKKMNVVMNDTRKKVLEVLKNAKEPMSLDEIAKTAGLEKLSTGTTNAMVTSGMIKKSGTKKVARVRYETVTTYEIGGEDDTAKTE